MPEMMDSTGFALPVDDGFDFTDLAFVDFESHRKNDSGTRVGSRSLRATARTCCSACSSSSSGGCRRVGIRSFINDGLCERAAAFRVDKGSLKLRLAAGFEKTFAQLDLRSILGNAQVRRCLQRGHVVCFNGLESR